MVKAVDLFRQGITIQGTIIYKTDVGNAFSEHGLIVMTVPGALFLKQKKGGDHTTKAKLVPWDKVVEVQFGLKQASFEIDMTIPPAPGEEEDDD